MQTIAVIIVNYGTPDLTIAAVDSVLARHHGGRAVEVHVVDNASPGGDGARLREAQAARGWGDAVTLHAETVNHGFGRGNNLVLEALARRPVPPDAVFLLNPDAALVNETLDILARRLEAEPRTGFAGAGISLPDGRAVTAAFRFPSVLGQFAEALSFGPITGRLAHRCVPLPPDHPDSDVDWVAGAALLIRFETLAEIGFFDPDFFLYFEEVELMWRGARHGWRCRYVPEAQAVHVEGAATDVKSGHREAKRHPSYRYDSWRLYFLKTHGRAGAVLAALAALTGSAGNILISGVRRRPRAPVPHFFGDFWRHAARPLLIGPPQRSARP